MLAGRRHGIRRTNADVTDLDGPYADGTDLDGTRDDAFPARATTPAHSIPGPPNVMIVR
jgi:hypothetical protein